MLQRISLEDFKKKFEKSFFLDKKRIDIYLNA